MYWCSDLGQLIIKTIRTIAKSIAILLNIRNWNQHIGIQDGCLIRFGFGFGLQFEIKTIQHPNNFWPFTIWMCSVSQHSLYWTKKVQFSDVSCNPVFRSPQYFGYDTKSGLHFCLLSYLTVNTTAVLHYWLKSLSHVSCLRFTDIYE